MKNCFRCELPKEYSDFYRDKTKKDGFSYLCKNCFNLDPKKIRARKLYSELHRESDLDRLKTWKKKKKEAQLRKIASRIRSRLSMALRGNSKIGSAVTDLGCSVAFLRQHLESQFQPGMAWSNYGRRGWHIDHIFPLSSFDLNKREDFIRAVHYTNLQPLWATQNHIKYNKIPNLGQKLNIEMSYPLLYLNKVHCRK